MKPIEFPGTTLPIAREILADIQRVAHDLGRTTLTVKEYRRLGSFSVKQVYAIFGSWLTALQFARLELSRPSVHVAKASLLQDMRRVALMSDQHTLTAAQYRRKGVFHSSTIAHAFGGWALALRRAGLAPAGKTSKTPGTKLGGRKR